MNKAQSSRVVTFKVILFTFLSVYISIFFYSLILPVIFLLNSEERMEFWRRMLLVVNVIEPMSVLIVYLFYRPVAKNLATLESGTQLTPAQLTKSETVSLA